MLLQEALRLYLLVDRAEQTQTTYERMLTRFVEDIGPRRHLDHVTPEDLDAYIADCAASASSTPIIRPARLSARRSHRPPSTSGSRRSRRSLTGACGVNTWTDRRRAS